MGVAAVRPSLLSLPAAVQKTSEFEKASLT